MFFADRVLREVLKTLVLVSTIIAPTGSLEGRNNKNWRFHSLIVKRPYGGVPISLIGESTKFTKMRGKFFVADKRAKGKKKAVDVKIIAIAADYLY